jgi:glucose/mannose-6-phosphate isomerase
MFKDSLDDLREYRNYDPSGVYETIQKLSQQFESGWHQSEFAQLAFDPDKIKNIVFVGMGASNFAGKILLSLSPYLLKIPLEVVSNYRLPSYTGNETLVILSSYSGDTQEVISCATDAKRREAPVFVITTGGQLLKISHDESWPTVKLDSKLNICGAPRMGLFLSLGAAISLIVRLNPESSKYIDLNNFLHIIEKAIDSGNRNRDTKTNPSKILATKHQNQGIVFVSANHLDGVTESIKNLFNESAKTFSVAFHIPDMNHHLMDGLIYPIAMKDNFKFIILNSTLYPNVIQRKIAITQETLSKLKYQVTVIKPESENPISQVLESLVFFTWFSYYLSIANKVDPSTNPWVDYFKKHL